MNECFQTKMSTNRLECHYEDLSIDVASNKHVSTLSPSILYKNIDESNKMGLYRIKPILVIHNTNRSGDSSHVKKF